MEQIFLAVFEALALMALGYVFARLKKHREDMQSIRKGLQSMLRNQIIRDYNHYVVSKGWIPIYAKQSVMACYESYEQLGTNGVIDDLIEQLRELPNYEKDKRVVK